MSEMNPNVSRKSAKRAILHEPSPSLLCKIKSTNTAESVKKTTLKTSPKLTYNLHNCLLCKYSQNSAQIPIIPKYSNKRN